MEIKGLLKVDILNEGGSYLQDTGTADAYVVAFVPAITALNAGQRVRIKAANTNTGASTLAVNGFSASIKKNVSVALSANDILSGQIIEFVYDGTNWQLGGSAGASGYSGFSGSGISGYSGFSGASQSGYSGYSGISGWSGYSGFSGISGWSGYSGFSGISGWSGYSGFSGKSGYSGYSGLSGYSGFSGSGTSGYSGFSGVSGWSGYSGYSGVSGYSGFSGSGVSGFSGSGLSGYSGFSGVSGYSGAGTTGTSGYSGFSGSYLPRTDTASNPSSVTVNIDSYNRFTITALAQACTINAPTGTPQDGFELMFRMLATSSTQRNLTWNAIFRQSTYLTLPTYVINKILYIKFQYNSQDSKWDLVSVLEMY